MFDFIDGHFVSRDPDGVLILYNERNGIGYSIHSLSRDWADVDADIEEVRVFVRAKFSDSDGYTLYGFEDPRYRRAFDVLCKAQGVGGKVAMSILNQLELGELVNATAATFKPVKGVGPKMALKILPEVPALADLVKDAAPSMSQGGLDALTGLVSIGYKREAAIIAVRKAVEETGSNDEVVLLRAATRILRS